MKELRLYVLYWLVAGFSIILAMIDSVAWQFIKLKNLIVKEKRNREYSYPE